jgi:hypothetical protein
VAAVSTTSSIVPPGSVPDATIITPSVPRGGVIRVEGTTCGDRVSVFASNDSEFFNPDFFSSYVLSGDLTPRPFTLGVSVPVSAAAGDYTLEIRCWRADAGGLQTVRTVTVTPDQVDAVVTAVSGPASGREGSSVHLVGSGCHSGGITATQARVVIGSSSGFSMTWVEHVVGVNATGDFVVDAGLPNVVYPRLFPSWYVTTYCVTADAMNYGEASTTIALEPPPPPSTTVPPAPPAQGTTVPPPPSTTIAALPGTN